MRETETPAERMRCGHGWEHRQESAHYVWCALCVVNFTHRLSSEREQEGERDV